MLNKLLKRCMPWQQSGKWIRIYYDGLNATSVQDITFRYPDNMSFSPSGGWGFEISFNRPVAIDFYPRLTVTHIASNKFSLDSNYFNPEPVPAAMLGTKGYIDYHINDIEVV